MILPQRNHLHTMIKRSIHNLVLGLLLLGAASTHADAEWKPLFNGKDLTGWVGMNNVNFEVKESNLRLVKGMGWLRSEAQFSDFILEVEIRPLEEKYDSGIFFRAGLEGKPWPDKSYQLNLRYDALAGLVKGYQPLVPSETARIKVGTWMKLRLEVRGTKAILDVDGERAWETDKLEAGKGYIGIQAEDKSFDFRNFRIQEIKGAQ